MFPFEITTLVLRAGMAVSLVAGELALYGGALSLHINVAPKITEGGFDADTADQGFITEAAQIVRGELVIPTPTLRVSSSPTAMSGLASPLRLESLVGALQDQFGYERLVVNAAMLIGPGDALRMLIVAGQPHQAPEQIHLLQSDGDAAALVRRAADATIAQASPFRVAPADYLRGLNHDPAALKEAKELTIHFPARSWDPARASERAMLHNLLALLMLLERPNSGGRAGIEARRRDSGRVAAGAGNCRGQPRLSRGRGQAAGRSAVAVPGSREGSRQHWSAGCGRADHHPQRAGGVVRRRRGGGGEAVSFGNRGAAG